MIEIKWFSNPPTENGVSSRTRRRYSWHAAKVSPFNALALDEKCWQQNMIFFLSVFIFHSALISLFIFYQWMATNEFELTSPWIITAVRATLSLCIFIAVLLRSDLLLASKKLNQEFKNSHYSFGTPHSKFDYHARSILFLLFTMCWLLFVLIWGSAVPFIFKYYILVFGFAISIGYLEFLTCKYEKYLDLVSRGKWGPVSKVW